MLLVNIDRLEAYHEMLHRRTHAKWDEERAYQVVLAATGDLDRAEHAANIVKFANTPLQ